MGWSNQAVSLIVLQEATTGFTGLFAYSPVPGPGNLVMSISANPGTDPFGNAYGRGVVAYGPGPSGPDKAEVGFVVAGSFPALGFTSGASSETRSAQLTEGVFNPNTVNEQIVLTIFGPQGGGASPNDSVQVELLSSTVAGPGISTGFIQYVDTAGGVHSVAHWGQHGFTGDICQLLTAAQPGTINTTLAAETWHTPVTTGFTTFAGAQPVEYRINALGNVEIFGIMESNAAYTGGTTIWTMPAGYVPPSNAAVGCVTDNGGVYSTNGVNILSTGAVSLALNVPINTLVIFDGGSYRLAA